MNETLIRPARKADCRQIAELFSLSSDGVADYIWTKEAAPGEPILDVGKRRYAREDALFSYRNCMVVEGDGDVVAMLVTFAMPDASGRVEDDPVLAPFARLEEPASYYISGLAVREAYRNRGLGSRLMDLAEDKALTEGLTKLSLIVLEQNTGAMRLYSRLGYREIAREPVVPHPLIRASGDALLMVKQLEL